MIAVYMKVNDDKLNSLKKMNGEDLFNSIEELHESDDCKYIDIDKMWDGLHFLLTGNSASVPIKNNKLSEAIIGVNVLSEDKNTEFISYSTYEELKKIVNEMNNVVFEDFEKRFNPDVFNKSEIYPNIWNSADKQTLITELKESYIDIKKFYETDFDAKSNIIVSIY